MIVRLEQFAANDRYLRCFKDELIDMEQVSPAFARILCRKQDVGRKRMGVTSQFLENAETYHRKYFNPDYFKHLIRKALDTVQFAQHRARILDLGAGSGNSVVAALELLDPELMVAVDISPQLLAILRDYLEGREDLSTDCILLCMDACENAYRPEVFDLAIGAAVLHHMPDPQQALAAVHHALRPGGHAVFFEPFESGNVILALAFEEILDCNAGRRRLDDRVTGLLSGTIRHVYSLRHMNPRMRNRLDDKWVFTRLWLEEIQQAVGFRRLQIYPLHATDMPFSRQTESLLQMGLGAGPDALPRWAWSILRRYDGVFSEHLKRELLIEGAIILSK